MTTPCSPARKTIRTTRTSRPARVALFAVLALVVLPLQADDGRLLAAERERFLEAKLALEKGDTARFSSLAKGLSDYPLYPYLRYWEGRRRIGTLDRDGVHDLLAELEPTPLAERLRRRWLRQLVDRGRWADYVADYRGGNTTDECHYGHALHRVGRNAEAWRVALKLWLVGRSQPRACDPLFVAWRAAGQLDEALAWQRVQLAMEKRQTGLARYLARFLGEPRRTLVAAWIDVHGDPRRHLDDRRLAADGPDLRMVVRHGLLRLARRDAAAAGAVWQRLAPQYAFTDAERHAIAREIALQRAYDTERDALDWFAGLPREWQDEAVLEWAVRTALRHRLWSRALVWLGRMEGAQRDEPRWRYWRARMLAETGDGAAADALYTELAAGRGYYEFLAADRVDRDYAFAHVPVPAEPALTEVLIANPAFVRARELFFAGLVVSARREWYAALDGRGDAMQLVAARLAAHWGWHDRAIFALGAAGYWDDLEIRFPLAFRERLSRHAKKQRLDPAWVYAVARQESAFAADARSPAGALGLMQIMPATGRSIARDLKSRLGAASQLLQPSRNLRYGTYYLRQLLDRHGGHPVLANAAYNAGPHRVRRWLPEDGSMAADVWIETVPFRETRDYMQRILAYTAIYQLRLGDRVVPLSDRMRPIVAGVAGGAVQAHGSG